MSIHIRTYHVYDPSSTALVSPSSFVCCRRCRRENRLKTTEDCYMNGHRYVYTMSLVIDEDSKGSEIFESHLKFFVFDSPTFTRNYLFAYMPKT